MFIGLTAGQFTTVSTTALHPVGALAHRPDAQITTAAHRGFGGQIWRYVKNGEASAAFAAGSLVIRKAATTDESCVLMPTTPVSRTYARGVAQHAIAAGSYGWILVRGPGLYVADASAVAADEVLIPDGSTAGAFDGQANTIDEVTEATQSYGYAITAANATTGTAIFNQIAL
jgi:hypothetical protein